MSYFSSLSQYNDTKNAVAQHTTEMEQSVKDAKADASQKAFEGYSQLLESAGGSTTGLAGGIHVTRKIYKKYKSLKQAGKDAKDALNKAKGGDNQEGQAEQTQAEQTEQQGEPDAPEPEAPAPEVQSIPEPEAPAPAPEPEVPAPEAPAPQSIPEPEPNGLEAKEPSTVETELSPEDNDYLQDILKRYPEDVQRGANLADEQSAETSNPEATTELSSFSNEGQGAESGAVRPTNTAPEPKGEEPQSAPPEPSTKAGAEGAVEDTEEASDRIEQGAQAFSKITPTPSGSAGGLGLDASADSGDLAEAGSSLLSTGLETAGTVLDFLGPVGEIAGAGIALGGFFHSLFDSSEKSKESDDENEQTNIAQGGGISAESLKTASQSTNLVGTTY